ncbi:MAG: WbqC family protein [Bacteroidetes bacterium]|nr:WbqC family protein [Bacteroidota bacterium]
MGEILLSTAYLPPVSYIAAIHHSDILKIEKYENYIKQSYRNRCNIMTSNGLLSLSIPVNKVDGNHTLLKDIRISYLSNWQMNHWRAIESAYNKSPFFLYYRDDLERFYKHSYEFLIDYNTDLLNLLLKKLNISVDIEYSEAFSPISNDENDYRYRISPKLDIDLNNFPHYYQVFEAKHGFIPDLSIIDLLFNEGPQAKNYFLK